MCAMSSADVYAAAGVDVAAGGRLARRLAPLAAATEGGLPGGARVLGGVGGFAAAVSMPAEMRAPVLVSATDGVGTKLALALSENAPDVIGQDVVAMCVNDLLCAGATPLFFLDYIACGRLDEAWAAAVVGAAARACGVCGCALVGGETAEMPGVYEAAGFDIAGFAVGVVERAELLLPEGEGGAPVAAPGDVLIGLGSSGAHSNGYSLIRQWLAQSPGLGAERVDGESVMAHLLRPTRLYAPAAAALRARGVRLRGLAHITGGGMAENLPRALPAGTRAVLEAAALPMPPLFACLARGGGVGEDEMRRVFNCGVGMVAVVAPGDADDAVRCLREVGERAWPVGVVAAGDAEGVVWR